MAGLFGLFWITAWGLSILLMIEDRVGDELDIDMILPVSFITGALTWGLGMFGLTWIGIPWSVSLLSVSWLFIGGVGYWKRKRLDEVRLWFYVAWKDRSWKVFFGLVAVIVALFYCTILTTNFLHSDALASWFMRGKIFYLDQGINREHLSDPIFADFDESVGSFNRVTYPPLVPIMYAWVFLLVGDVVVWQAKILGLALVISIVWLLFIEGKRLYDGAWVWQWWGVGWMLSLPAMAWALTVHWYGNATLWMTSLYLAGMICFGRWLSSREHVYLILGGLLIGGAAFTKSEGVVGWWMLAFLLVIFRKLPKKLILVCLGLLLIPGISWQVFAVKIVEEGSFVRESAANLGNVDQISQRFWDAGGVTVMSLLNVRFFLGLWPVFLASSVYYLWNYKKKRWEWWIFEGMLWVVMGFLWLILLIGSAELESTKHMPRFLLQWAGVAIYLVLINVRPFILDKTEE